MKRSPLSAARVRRAVITAAVTLAAAGTLGVALTGVFTTGARSVAPLSGDSTAAPSAVSSGTARTEAPERGLSSVAGATAPAGAPKTTPLTAQSAPAPGENAATAAGVTVRAFTMEPPAPAPWTEERARPAPNAAGDGHVFTQARGHYTAEITGAGVSLTFGEGAPAGTPPFSLRLKSADPASESEADAAGSSVRLSGNTVEIPRGENITEWYRNTPDGVMQGLTLACPQSGAEPGQGVRLELSPPQTWTTAADAGDTSIRFRHAANGAEVGYENLLVSDATGRRLPSRMEPLEDGSGVALLASDKGAVYPVTVDPVFTVRTILGARPSMADTRLDRFAPEVLGSTLFFTLLSSQGKSLGLWSVRMTEEGAEPRLVGDLDFGDAGGVALAGKLGDKIYVWNPAAEFFTWTENSAAGKREHLMPTLSTSPGFFTKRKPFLFVHGGRAYFDVANPWPNGGLYSTDGSSVSRLIGYGPPPTGYLNRPEAAPNRDTLVINWDAGASLEYRKSSGETGVYLSGGSDISLAGALSVNGSLLFQGATGILAVRDDAPGVREVARGGKVALGAVLGTRAYFSQNGFLMKADGAPGGTSQVPLASLVTGPVRARNGSLYFDGGTDVWRSDGTAGGTAVLKSSAKIAAAGENLLYLLVTTAEQGEELWVSDGTAAGTRLLKDITPGPASTAYSDVRAAGDFLLFQAGGRLWRSNGTTEGTVPLFVEKPVTPAVTAMSSLAPAGSRVFLTATTAQQGAELWVADPAAGTARLVRDILPGAAGSAPYYTTAFGEGAALFFITAADGTRELWRSDGTSGGTALLRGGITTGPAEFLVSGGAGWYVASAGGGAPALWRTDGTPEGTVAVKSHPAWAVLPPFTLTAYDGGVTFLAGTEGTTAADNRHGTVWTSDGTAAGTLPGEGVNPGYLNQDTLRRMLLATEGKVFFRGPDSKLWMGTGAPPHFSVILPDSPAVFGVEPVWAARGRIFFKCNANFSSEGRLGSSDGTPGNLTLGLPLDPGVAFILNFVETTGAVFMLSQTQFMPNGAGYAMAIDLDTVSASASYPGRFERYLSDWGYFPVLGSAKAVGHMMFFTAPENLGRLNHPLEDLAMDGSAGGVYDAPWGPPEDPRFPSRSISTLAPEGDHGYFVASGVLGQELRVITVDPPALRVTASPPEGGSVTGGVDRVTAAGKTPVTAVPAAGYYFSRWEGPGIERPLAASTTVAVGPTLGTVRAAAVFSTAPQTYAEWAAAAGLTGAEADPAATPAGDGTANLLKYAFHLAPRTPAHTLDSPDPAAGLPLVSVRAVPDGRALRFEYVRRRATRVIHTAEHSADGVVWEAVTATPSLTTLDETWERVSVTQPLPPDTDRRYGRVRVVMD